MFRLLLVALTAWLSYAPVASAGLHMHGVAAGGVVSTFKTIAGHRFTTATDSVTWDTTGVVNGDLMVAFYCGSPGIRPVFTVSGSGATLTQVAADDWVNGTSLSNVVYAKTVTASDISSATVTTSGAETWGPGVAILLYHGGTTVTRKTFADVGTGTSSLTLTGYSQVGTAIALICQRSNNTTWTWTPPAGWTVDHQVNGSDGAVANYDFTQTGFFRATSGITATTYTWTGFDTGGQAGTILEIN